MHSTLAVPLIVSESLGIKRRQFPTTRGVPFPIGSLKSADFLRLVGPDGAVVPMQMRVLSKWQDDSFRWLLVDWQADVEANGEATYTLVCDDSLESRIHPSSVTIAEDDDSICICTGPLLLRVNKRRFSVIEEAVLGAQTIFEPSLDRDAIIAIQESFVDDDGQRCLFGLGGESKASLATDAYSARVEEMGSMRVVIRCDGMYEADIPMGHYRGYCPFHFTTRLYAYAGQSFVRVLHTIVVACNPDQVVMNDVYFRLTHSLGRDLQFVVGADSVIAGQMTNMLIIDQSKIDGFCFQHNTDDTTEGYQAEGWLAIHNDRCGIAVIARNFTEEYPRSISASLSDGSITVGSHLGSTPPMRATPDNATFRRYSRTIDRKSQEGIYSDGLGTAKTSELFLHFFVPSNCETLATEARQLRHPLHVRLDSGWCDDCHVVGGFAPRVPGMHQDEETMMSELLAWLERHITSYRWYGMFDYGDVKVGYDYEKDEWRDRGRWGWNNSEWDFRHGVWIQYLRTGDEKLFRLCEALTRHSVDVDTCHYHPLRPYFVGGCFRHSVDHWGDEPCASHTFIENWLDYYFLTGDARTFDVIREAGDFFMRFHWSHDPRYSFSLRTVANVFRGLLHLYELTWESKYLERAEELLDVILRGQNEDGSWYKRFVICKEDRLPEYLPFGMATEGTTTAIEMHTMPPFSMEELAPFNRPLDKPELSPEELKGYQTHYLMVGLEQYHRLTKRDDVATSFVRAVDWFCSSMEHAVRESYFGILSRECAYAYRLTGNKRYLEAGRAVVNDLTARQDMSDNALRRGSVISVDPLPVSMVFWGVPYFLKTESDAGTLNE